MLGTRIATLRRQNGLSQAALAHELSISASTVGMYEQGRREPSIQTAVRMARVFDISVDYLLTGNICTEKDIVAFLRNDHLASNGKTGSDGMVTLLFSREELIVLHSALLMDERMNEEKVREILRMLNEAGTQKK